MIYKVDIGYEGQEAIIKHLAEHPDDLGKLKKMLSPGSYVKDEDLLKERYNWPSEVIIDMDVEGVFLSSIGCPLTIKRIKGTRLHEFIPSTGGVAPVKVYVQVSNIGLLTIDEVKVEEDYCTERLQVDLDQGWRILCVCPPNDTRRPTYILGRTKARE